MREVLREVGRQQGARGRSPSNQLQEPARQDERARDRLSRRGQTPDASVTHSLTGVRPRTVNYPLAVLMAWLRS